VFTCAAVVIGLGRERRGVTFGEEAEARGFEVVRPPAKGRELESDAL